MSAAGTLELERDRIDSMVITALLRHEAMSYTDLSLTLDPAELFEHDLGEGMRTDRLMNLVLGMVDRGLVVATFDKISGRMDELVATRKR